MTKGIFWYINIDMSKCFLWDTDKTKYILRDIYMTKCIFFYIDFDI